MLRDCVQCLSLFAYYHLYFDFSRAFLAFYYNFLPFFAIILYHFIIPVRRIQMLQKDTFPIPLFVNLYIYTIVQYNQRINICKSTLSGHFRVMKCIADCTFCGSKKDTFQNTAQQKTDTFQ